MELEPCGTAVKLSIAHAIERERSNLMTAVSGAWPRSSPIARRMAKRAGSKITEIKASHAVLISQPRAVARVIEEAAHAIN
jgi:hypothetical protein